MNGIRHQPNPISDRAELNTLPVGLYTIPSERKIVSEYFSVSEYRKFKDVPVVPIARVVEEIPFGLTDGQGVGIAVRGDGKVILSGWEPEPGWEPKDWLELQEQGA